MNAQDAFSVTVLSGSLTAGRTTPLNRGLNSREVRRVAVIVTDMSEVNNRMTDPSWTTTPTWRRAA